MAETRQAATPWMAGMVNRWHTHPNLANSKDDCHGHSARVAVLILQFKPDASSSLLKAAITHDLGEHAVGDISYPAKVANPEMADMLWAMEQGALEAMELKYPVLTAEETRILKLCDRLDAYLWALHHQPFLVLTHPRWTAHRDEILEMGTSAEEIDRINNIMTGVQEGGF